MAVPGTLPRGFSCRTSPLLLAGWEERLGRRRRRRCRDGGQRRQRLRVRRREEDLEQAVPGESDDEAAARAGVEQDEGRRDARATVADDDEGVMHHACRPGCFTEVYQRVISTFVCVSFAM